MCVRVRAGEGGVQKGIRLQNPTTPLALPASLPATSHSPHGPPLYLYRNPAHQHATLPPPYSLCPTANHSALHPHPRPRHAHPPS